NKEYYRATRRGKIIKVVREVYLRDDIACGHSMCTACEELNKTLYKTIDEQERAAAANAELTAQNVLVLDTNVVLHQIDLLEDPAITNVVVLTTVLDEVKNQNFAIHNRLREIIKNHARHFYVYSNEHSRHTAIERESGETPNDRNDRAIRVATEWYRAHLSKYKVKVNLVTNDKDNLKKAKALGLDGMTIQDLVMQMSEEHPSLVDKLSAPDDDEHTDSTDSKRFQFPEHKSVTVITDLLKKGELHQGILRTDQSNYLEARIRSDQLDKEILIKGLEAINRAVDGDVVAVELLPRDQWTAPSGVVLMDTEALEEDDDSIAKDARMVETHQPTGRVVGIIKRNWKPYCGAVEFKGDAKATTGAVQLLFVPIDRRIPRIRIRSRQVGSIVGKRIVVAIDSWERHSKYPTGHFVKDLGPLGDKETESQVLLLQFDIPHHPFGASVMKCLPPANCMDNITPVDMIGRRDLRSECVFSVDPPGCTDIDDALHCKKLPDGNYEVGVHIADVSHFVREGTSIDEEAAHRGTTVYLVDRRIDMLPGELSGNLCSLMSNVDRYSFSCIWKLDEAGNVLDVEYTKSLIRSVASLTYEQAQIKIDDATQQDQVSTNLRMLLRLSKVLKTRRFEAGALYLASPQVKFKTEELGGDPSDVELYQMRETNSMIEEFMLLANIWVAKKIHKHFPGCALLRRHPTPKASSFELLSKLIEQKGFTFNAETSKLLSASLDACVIEEDPYFNTLCRIMTTRCMSPAVYFSSGSLPYEDFRHYGLASDIYTHFTSPIRRYPDVIVHRLLASAIGVQSVSLNMENKTVSNLCEGFNFRHRMAQYAGRGSTNLHTLIFFKGRKTVEKAYIIRVKANAFVVLVPRYGFEGTVYVAEPNAPSSFTYDCVNQTLSNDTLTFRVFDPVTVEIFVDDSKAHDQKLKIICINPSIPSVTSSSSKSANITTFEESIQDVKSITANNNIKKKSRDEPNDRNNTK
ncbi:hypothetical protein SAMD00019534_028060, partial [Acytostelium subglobosum LB1]|uniref:hypothetical protein n=1 Tax=Acytostelium subglobosum LB1 TaxID=1410327 RepID=UPI000644A6C9